MRLLDISRRSARSLLGSKARTVLTVSAIAVGAFALTLTLGASNGAQKYAQSIITDNFDPSQLIVSADDSLFSTTDSSKPKVYDPNYGSIISSGGATTQIKMLTDKDLNRLRTIPGVATVRPATQLNVQYLTRDGQKKYVATVQAYNAYKKPNLLAGAVPARLSSHDLLLPEAFIAALGFSSPQQAIGQPVRLSIKRQVDGSSLLTSLLQGDTTAASSTLSDGDAKEAVFTVTAVTKKPSTLIQPGTALYLYASPAAVDALNDYATLGSASYHHYISAYASVADGTDVAKLHAAQAKIKTAGYAAQSVIDTEKIITQVITVLEGIVAVFGLIAVVASVFGIVNTMYISVLQRTREIGLMKALGMHKRDISKLFLLEAGLLGLLGGLVGALLAVALGTILNPVISKQLGLGSVHLLQFQLNQICLLIMALALVAIIAGLLPSRKAARLDPIAALRTE